MNLIVATNNKHKLDEIRAILEDKAKLLSLKDIGHEGDIPETTNTLEGNALMKAHYIYERYGQDCFADDTGLEVEALNGAPGVYSARYAGEENNAEANMQKLLNNMEEKNNRSAQFRTVIALILKGKEYLFEGTVKGEILRERCGKEGFGYDPIFRPDGYDQSFAELGNDVKNQISHRARALEALNKFLEQGQ